MKKQIIITAITIFSILILSCEKDIENVQNSGIPKSTLTELFKTIAPPMQNFTFNAGQTKTIVGEKGTNVTFYSNSLKKKDGSLLTTGSVTIVLQEMLTGPEMILAGKSTRSGDKLLTSGGQIFIKAYQNGEELFVNSDNPPLVKIPANNQIPMDLFKGNNKPTDSLVGDSTLDWDETKDSVNLRMDSFYTSGNVVTFNWTYSFGFEEFGYWNCDQFYNFTGEFTDIKVKCPSGFNHENTQVYIYFKSENSVIKCEGFDKLENHFIINHGLAPVGSAVTIVTVSKKDNQHYLDVKSNIVITKDIVVNSSPQTSTEAAIKAAIKAL